MKENAINILRRLMIVGLATALLVACGGGSNDTPTAPQPPSITQQPTSITVNAGQTANFTVQATGTEPLAYIWQRSSDGLTWTDVTTGTGMTSASYTTAATSLTDNGTSFRVSVSNAASTSPIMSNAALLGVELPLALDVNFDSGSYTPLAYTSGRTDSPADADPTYSANIQSGALVFAIPATPLIPSVRPKLSGFLDLPTGSGYAPIAGDMNQEFTFTDVSQLLALAPNALDLAIAGSYVRGAYEAGTGADWSNGDTYGGFWFGFVRNPDGSRQSVIRSGNTNLVAETFSATQSISYRIVKRGTSLALFRRQDGATDWTQVGGSGITITLRAGGSAALAISHVRVLNNSDAAATVTADNFRWYY